VRYFEQVGVHRCFREYKRLNNATNRLHGITLLFKSGLKLSMG